MPEATPFNFAGNPSGGFGSGFPYCPDKVDVSDFGFGQPYDYWTTLSGVNKDSPTTSEALIEESREHAMALLWNIDGYTGDDSECTSTFDFGGGENTAEVSFPVGSADATSGSLDEPKDRVCIVEPASEKYQVLDESTDDVIAKVVCGAPEIVRMYNGDETDEDNFVGYGVKPDETLFMQAGELGDWSVEIRSYIQADDPSTEDIAYTEINDMHFVCLVLGYTGTGIVMDAANRSVYADEGNIITSIKIDELDFYTYPT